MKNSTVVLIVLFILCSLELLVFSINPEKWKLYSHPSWLMPVFLLLGSVWSFGVLLCRAVIFLVKFIHSSAGLGPED